MNTKRTSSPRPSVVQVHAELMSLDARVGTLQSEVSENAAAQAAVNVELEAKIAEMRSEIEQLDAGYEAIRTNPNLSAPEKHRKHTSLSKCIKGMLDRLTALEARDPASPGYVDAVNADLAQLRDQIGELNELKTTVSDHGMRLDLLDPAVAALTDTVAEHETRLNDLNRTVNSTTTITEELPGWAWVVVVAAGVAGWWGFANADFPIGSWRHDMWFAPLMGVLIAVMVFGLCTVLFGGRRTSSTTTVIQEDSTDAPAPADQPITQPVPVTAS